MPEKPSLSMGVEEEYQIIDPETRELRSYITQFLGDSGQLVLQERKLMPEMMQSQVEMGTPICKNIQEVREEVVAMRSAIGRLAAQHNLAIAAAATHPFSSWEKQEVTPTERHHSVLRDMGILGQRLLIFGLHVHIGIEDREFAMDCMSTVRYLLPHCLALSTSSPFWNGRNTRLKSYRSIVFEDFPRSGMPHNFGSWSEYEGFTQTLVRTNCIDNPKRIWWDIRPHPYFPTLEFRVCDMCTRVDEVVAMAALFQALVAKMYQLRQQNLSFRKYRKDLIEENKWRAIRDGIQGKLIDFGIAQELPASDLIRELLGFVDDVVDELGSRQEISYIYKILENGTSADRQLAVYERTNDLKAVVDHLVKETLIGCN